MRFLITADTHFGKKLGGDISKTFDIFSQVIDQAIKRKIDYIIVAGDVYNRSRPKKRIIGMANDLFNRILINGIGLILIPGNHDRGYLHVPLDYYFHPYSNKFHIINNLTTLKFEGFQLMLIPFSKKWPEKEIAEINIPTVIICHETFHGAKFGPQRYTFTKSRDNAIMVDKPPSNLKLIFSGHIHEPQELRHAIPIIYTGSLERLSFAEIYDIKGFYILQDMKYEFIKLRAPNDMAVIEVNGNFGVEMICAMSAKEIKNSTAERIMVRILNRKLNHHEYKYIRSKFPYQIKIIPSGNKILRQLYTKTINYQK